MIRSRGSIAAWAGQPSYSTIPAYRSSYRDYAAEQTHTPHAVMEAALGHVLKNEDEAAYARSDLFEKRHTLMESWLEYPPPDCMTIAGPDSSHGDRCGRLCSLFRPQKMTRSEEPTMKYQFAGLITVIVLSGCTVTAVDLGGSKSDGTVSVGANVGEFDSVDWSGTQARAKRRCIAWGYRDAEAFEGIRKRCVAHSGFVRGSYGTTYGASGCAEWEVSRTYQCLD